jgi:hypothetical protein
LLHLFSFDLQIADLALELFNLAVVLLLHVLQLRLILFVLFRQNLWNADGAILVSAVPAGTVRFNQTQRFLLKPKQLGVFA